MSNISATEGSEKLENEQEKGVRRTEGDKLWQVLLVSCWWILCTLELKN